MLNFCDKCGKPVPRWNDATLLITHAYPYDADSSAVMTVRARHLVPVDGCEGSPSRSQYLVGMRRDLREGMEYDPGREEVIRATFAQMLMLYGQDNMPPIKEKKRFGLVPMSLYAMLRDWVDILRMLIAAQNKVIDAYEKEAARLEEIIRLRKEIGVNHNLIIAALKKRVEVRDDALRADVALLDMQSEIIADLARKIEKARDIAEAWLSSGRIR